LIKSDLRHPWTIAELAAACRIGAALLQRAFHRMYGVSASDFLRTSRLSTARDALLQLGLSVTEAAYAVGYANPANFSTAFRKYFGIRAEQLPSRQTLLTLVHLRKKMTDCPIANPAKTRSRSSEPVAIR